MVHDVLGRLVVSDDAEFGRSFKGLFVPKAGPVKVSIEADGGPEEAALSLAAMLVQNWDVLLAKVEVETVAKFLGSYNDDWRAAEDPILTEQDFAERLIVEHLQVLGGACCSLWFSDRDFFIGHSIHVDLFDVGPTPETIETAKIHPALFG